MAEAKSCDICGQDSHQAVLVHTETDAEQKSYCMRCFHALLHGMNPPQLKERWKEFQATQNQA